MGCYRCDAVQTDPAKGKSPWARLVVESEQVLICPDCQSRDPEWPTAADNCGKCGGHRLRAVLGSVICGECGAEYEKQPFG